MSAALQHTLGHIACPACDEAKHAAMHGIHLEGTLFAAAAAQWLGGRRKLSPGARRSYEENLLPLNRFFGELRLDQVHIGHVRQYQSQRQEEIRHSPRHIARAGPLACDSDGASRINHEVGCLGQVLRQAGLWDAVKRFYEPLPLPKESPGMALSADEERHLFEVARSRKRWFVAYCCGLISRNTTAGPGEIRHLRLGDIEIDGTTGSYIHVHEGVKTEFRKRPLPLNDDAKRAVLWLMERAVELGCCAPEHFLLPHRAHSLGLPPDPLRPMGSWKKAHAQMCKEAAKKYPRLARFRPYDWRHTGATDLLENPAVSFTTIEHILGHRIDSRTKRKYDHLRNSALRAAAEALNRRHTDLLPMPPSVQTPARAQPPATVQTSAQAASTSPRISPGAADWHGLRWTRSSG